MLLDEFRDALAALPAYAPVEVRGQLSRAPIGAVDYDQGVIRVIVDDVELVPAADDEDNDEDEDADLDRGADDVVYLSTFRHRARMFGQGCAEGYPLCCVLSFVLVWTPLVWRAPSPLARRLRAFWVPGPVEHIPCPWHRGRASRRSSIPDLEVHEGVR